MNDSLKILFVSAEVAPFAKQGGLGDVAGSLPKALHAAGHDVRIVMPAYRAIEQGYHGVNAREDLSFQVPVRGSLLSAGVFESKLPGSDVPVYFIAEQNLFNRERVYGYDDDAYRFAFFSRAAMALTYGLEWTPDVLHAHDWHTAPAILWLKTAGQTEPALRNIKTVFTIHNLAHQGRVGWDIVDYLQLQTHRLNEEPFGRVNLMARGIYHADHVTTVSPTYAREIMTPNGGADLDGLLRHRGSAVSGILNGIDEVEWNPATDKRLPAHFSAENLTNRLKVRHALQDYVGLPHRDDVPLVALISRLDWQKGIDLMGEVVTRLMRGDAGEAQFVILGSGNPVYENMFRTLESQYSDRMRAVLSYEAALAPLIYGGADMFLMPSLFEPCGLSQILSMRYGTVPIVRATGGLVDTVQNDETGFVFYDFTIDAFWATLAGALNVFNVDKVRWEAIQQAGMTQDYSWKNSAEQYINLYHSLLA